MDELQELNKELEEAGLDPIGDIQEEQVADLGEQREIIPPVENPDDESEEESKTDEVEEESEEEESDEGEEEPPRKPASSHSVPYSQYKQEKDHLREQVEFWKTQANKSEKQTTQEQQVNPLNEAVTKLAGELGLDTKKTETLLTTVVDLAKRQAIPPDLMKRLEAMESRTQQDEERRNAEAEAQYFNQEYSAFEPVLRDQFPGATDAQLAKAREAIDIISHSTRFASIPDLEYIFTKTRKDIEEHMGYVAKKKGFEQGRRSVDESRKDFEAPEMGHETPKAIQDLEAMFDNDDDGLDYFDSHGKKIR